MQQWQVFLDDQNILETPQTIAFPALGFLTGVMFFYKWPSANNNFIGKTGTEDYGTFNDLTRFIQGCADEADCKQISNLDDCWDFFQNLVEQTGCRDL